LKFVTNGSLPITERGVISEDTALAGPERVQAAPEYRTLVPTHRASSAACTSDRLAGPTATSPGGGSGRLPKNVHPGANSPVDV